MTIPPLFFNNFLFGIDLPRCIINVFHSAADLTIKVYNLVVHYFKALQSIGVLSYSIKSIFMDYLPAVLANRNNAEIQVQDLADVHFDNIQDIKQGHYLGQGLLFGGSGMFSMTAALGTLGYLELGSSLPFVSGIGSGLFLLGCLFSLERHIELYLEAEKMAEEANGEQKALAERIKTSAILGIISDLGYTAITFYTLFGSELALYLLLGSFAIFSISLKLVYDFFFLQA